MAAGQVEQVADGRAINGGMMTRYQPTAGRGRRIFSEVAQRASTPSMVICIAYEVLVRGIEIEHEGGLFFVYLLI